MDALELLLNRSSAAVLSGPAPSTEALEAMIRAAVRAPDHGRLRPWRFVAIHEEAREAFGEVLADYLKRIRPDVTEDMLAIERNKAFRSPMILVVACPARPTEKIPRVEQLLSAGAAAENILLAAQALGYGAVWKTGGPAYDAGVKRALGLEAEDDIVAFLYIGVPASDAPVKPPASRPEPSEVLADWRGAQAALAPADA